MRSTLPLKTAVNFSPSVENLRDTNLRQVNILHQTTCDSKNRISSIASEFDDCRRVTGNSFTDRPAYPDFIIGDDRTKIKQR